MKLTRLSGRPVAIAVTVACTLIACQGDDSSEAPDARATGGAAGTSDATGSGGGTGGEAGMGGSDDAGQGGASGQGGSSVSDSGPDVRPDVSGTGGSSTSDASDASLDRSEGGARDAAPEASAGPCPLPIPDGGEEGGDDAGLHYQLYSFDVVDGGATGIGDWSNYAPAGFPNVTSSVDDFEGESAATPGALQAQMTFPFVNRFGSTQDIERQGLFNNPQNFSCFTRMHMWIKITTPASSFLALQPYVNTVFGTYYSGATLAAIADGNWHELDPVTLSGATSAITKYGVRFHPFDAAPPDAGPGPDGGPPVPDPVDVLIDNVWLE